MTDLKKRLFAGLLALVLLCAPLSGCAAREAERYDVLAVSYTHLTLPTIA